MRRALIPGIVFLALCTPAFATPSTHVFAGSGIAPAIPHTVTQGYLGVDIRDITDDRAKALNLKEVRGAEICMIDHDGPAIKAGLRENDVILSMNGQPVEGEAQLRRMLSETPAGRTVTFVYSRDGQQQTVSVQLADREEVQRRAWEQHFAVPEPEPDDSAADADDTPQAIPPPSVQPPATYPGFGFMGHVATSSNYTGAILDPLGPQLAQYFGAQPGTGLLVKSIDAGSPAERAGLHAGDVVLRVNTAAVASNADWLHAVQSSNGKPMTLIVLRDKKQLKLTLNGMKHSQLLTAPPAWVIARFRCHHVQRSGDWV